MATFNFSSLQQKQDQLIYTIDEIVEMLRKLPSSGYQTVEYYDKKGNLVRKQIPNIGQLIDQFRQGVNAQMSKTVYVDRVNGSDTSGDGSPNAPFKSIPKAENSVPPGGIVNIKLLSDYTIEDAIRIDNNRIVVITGAEVNPDGSPIITLRNNPNNIRSKIVITDAILILDNIRLECNNNGDKPHWSTLLKVGNHGKATISIGRWVDLSQYRHPVEIVLNHPMLNIETSICQLIIRHAKVIAPTPQNLVTYTGNGKCIYTADGVLDVNGNVTFPQIGIN